jgi:hypothetical protein
MEKLSCSCDPQSCLCGKTGVWFFGKNNLISRNKHKTTLFQELRFQTTYIFVSPFTLCLTFCNHTLLRLSQPKKNTRAIYVLLGNYLLDEKWSRRPHAKSSTS